MTHPKPQVALVRGPIVSTVNAFNNEATPAIGYAYISAYIERRGYAVELVDAIGEGLDRFTPLENFPGYHTQGLTFE